MNNPSLPHAPSLTSLEEKIATHKIRAGIIGLGYVGLPLAVEFAKAGVEVFGIDVDSNKISAIQKKTSYIQDVPSDTVADLVDQKKLYATTDFSVIRNLDTVNICVPTPLRKSKDPDISYIVSATQEIAKYLHEGMLIILESTTYPGTTEEVILPMLEEKGLKVGKDFCLAFSPERVDPGNPNYNTRNIPKVVGGITPRCSKIASQFYRLAIDSVYPVSSPKAAEMVKLLENTFRSVNIGLVNELCQMSEKLGVNVWEVIDAAGTKPFGFMPFYPGPGLGGHCIPIDPHYLAWKARIHGFEPRFIDLAGEINRSMPEFVVRKAQWILNERKKSIKGSKILVLGVAYKKNVSDFRESPALEIIELLEKYGAEVSYSDPFVPELRLQDKTYHSTVILRPEAEESHSQILRGAQDDTKRSFDLAILVTDHDQFDRKSLVAQFSLILDTRNAFRGVASDKIIRI
ncbi:MAG: nucleotide sugar dehydrogenase [Candidatus Omnitrophica bacterium]|nr:nucleotide sugar dehydrogenase [Candidatus Omnitrophota bacterium]